MEWFKLSKPRAASRSVAPESTIEAPAVEVPPIPDAVTAPEPALAGPAQPPAVLQIPAARPAPIPAKSPKATFDTFADEPKVIRPVPKPKSGFTISSSKNGETSEIQLTSPTLTVAKARMLLQGVTSLADVPQPLFAAIGIIRRETHVSRYRPLA